MENHQKNSGGNATIAEYVSRLYHFPKDCATLAYLSQLTQAHCMKVGNYRASDNFFDLYPHRLHKVRVGGMGGAGVWAAADLQTRRRTLKLAESY